MQNIAMNWRVSKTTFFHTTKLSTRVAHGRGSISVSRQCYTLCTSGTVDDVMFATLHAFGHGRVLTMVSTRCLMFTIALFAVCDHKRFAHNSCNLI